MAKNNVNFTGCSDSVFKAVTDYKQAQFQADYSNVVLYKPAIDVIEAEISQLDARIAQDAMQNMNVDTLVKKRDDKKSRLEVLQAEKKAVNVACRKAMKDATKTLIPEAVFQAFEKSIGTDSKTKYRSEIRTMLESFGLTKDDKCIKTLAKQLYNAVGEVQKTRAKESLETGLSTKNMDARGYKDLMTRKLADLIAKSHKDIRLLTDSEYKAEFGFTYDVNDAGQMTATVIRRAVVELSADEKKKVAAEKKVAEKKTAKKTTKKATK